MDRIPIWVLPILILLITPMAISQEEVKQALVQFMDKLSPGENAQKDANWGWKMTSDPCNWAGVTCYPLSNSVWQIGIEKSNLSGVFDASSVCRAKDLLVLSLKDNTIYGTIGEEIGQCKQLTHLYLSENNFSGSLPDSLRDLGNLKRLEISANNFSGELPDLPRISGLRIIICVEEYPTLIFPTLINSTSPTTISAVQFPMSMAFSLQTAFWVILDYVDNLCQLPAHLLLHHLQWNQNHRQLMAFLYMLAI